MCRSSKVNGKARCITCQKKYHDTGQERAWYNCDGFEAFAVYHSAEFQQWLDGLTLTDDDCESRNFSQWPGKTQHKRRLSGRDHGRKTIHRFKSMKSN